LPALCSYASRTLHGGRHRSGIRRKRPAKALSLVRDAVAARGGEAFLKITTVESRGQFTPFENAVSGDPMPFVDYIVYRHESAPSLVKATAKQLQSNSETSQLGVRRHPKDDTDQKEEQVSSFSRARATTSKTC